MEALTTKIITLVAGSIFSIGLNAQQLIQASNGAINRPTPKIGFNTNGHMPANFPVGYSGANWSQQVFIDSTASLNPGVLRYPGGTNANHWDWQTGWYKPGYQPPFPGLTIRADEFQAGLNASNAEGLYVLNLETSTVDYEMDGVRHLNSIGLNPTMIELGNEHNLANSAYPLQLISSQNYAQLSKTYYDSVKAILPQSKVCVVGSNTGQQPNWHSDILAANPNIDAFAWHAYLNANNADLVFHVNRALAVAFGNASNPGSLPNRYNQGGFNTLPANKEIWVTEYNLWETQLSSVPVIAESWTHTLYLTALHNYFLSTPNVTMFLNHSLASIDPWHESISRHNQHITANGIAMKLLLDVAKGTQSTQNISFAGNPTITYGTTTFPKLVGWKFTNGSQENGFICNFSTDTFIVSLQQVYSNPMDYITFSADTNFLVRGISSLNRQSGTSSDQITILPYSFTQVFSSQSSAGISEKENHAELVLFPNPTSDRLHFSKKLSGFKVYNSLGQLILDQKDAVQEISTGELKNGIYLLETDQKVHRFAVNH